MERYLTINIELNCFLWYVYTFQPTNTSISRSSQDVIIWIFDPENAEPSERNNIATTPPLYSRTLSKQFWILGQFPKVKTRIKSNHYASTAFPEEGTSSHTNVFPSAP
ncbi:cation channel sperm-associated auxiliary subunit epsilon-like isoform X1 [Sphaerodactylus townsendi]|uniref:cation channel sperm-associated auxiliary subunit epsilon-like isoform X1 n=1 Tax=Sphaerodactylus townsendi TaxID=933632 RepID=UPI0020266A73|nr:cation channel sperm-associated auxiliary subunit epsilon-like isoform X1 [Sphaerodactylus townsendi]